MGVTKTASLINNFGTVMHVHQKIWPQKGYNLVNKCLLEYSIHIAPDLDGRASILVQR